MKRERETFSIDEKFRVVEKRRQSLITTVAANYKSNRQNFCHRIKNSNKLKEDAESGSGEKR